MVARPEDPPVLKTFMLACTGWLLAMLILSQAGPAGRAPVIFALSYGIGFGLMILMVRFCPREWSFRQVAFTVFLLGLLGRVLFWEFPVSNDVYRYIWEGYLQNQGFSPYQHPPDDPLLASLIHGDMAAIWQQINHKNLSAGYPPLAMLIFRGLAAISPTPMMFKGAMLGFDLLTLTTLMAMIRWRKVAPANLIWYAANPFVLVYVAGEAHVDMIQAFFLTGGLYAMGQNKTALGFAALGAAAVSKYLAVVALPFVIHRSRRHAWLAVAVVGLCFLPFMDDPSALFHSLFIFGSQMHYNDGLAEITRFFLGQAAPLMLILMLLGFLVLVFLFVHDSLRSVYLALGAVLVCLPTLHPWYLLLVAPLMVIYPSRVWLYLMLAMLATLPVLVHEYHTGVFLEIRWLKLIEYLPFFSLMIWDTLHRRPFGPPMTFASPRSVSVVMPVLNEADRVETAIQAVQAEPQVAEIVVVDGGSHDATQKRARQTGALVVAGPRGRGYQVRAGVDRTSGDVVLVLHADTLIVQGALERMMDALKAYPAVAGGAFEMAFRGPSPQLKLIAWLNNVRARWSGISFGDQGQFFRREALANMGGFPAMMLMEDVELSLRLKRMGHPLFIRQGVRVSSRRWAHRGVAGNVWLVLKLFVGYLVERRLRGSEGVRKDYYRHYYGKGSA
ncbi:MAG: TIGR04283 family arsenosugar biosynthesis glycosyltransferase [Desulfobacterales bacterium]